VPGLFRSFKSNASFQLEVIRKREHYRQHPWHVQTKDDFNGLARPLLAELVGLGLEVIE